MLTLLKGAIPWHLVHLQCCANIPTVQLQDIFIIPRGNSVPMKQSLPTPPRQPLETTNLLSVSVDLPAPGISYECTPTACGLWCLASFTCASMLSLLSAPRSFLLLNNRLVYGLPHFVYSCISWCTFVSTFCLLWSLTMRICVQVFVWTSVFNSLGYLPGGGSAGSYGNSMFNWLRNCQLSAL